MAKSNLALTLYRIGDRPRAIMLLEQAVASQRRTLPVRHPNRAKVLAPLATMLALEVEIERAAELAAEERQLHLADPVDEGKLREEARAWALRVAAKAREELTPMKLGRNDPCWCGSGKMFKTVSRGLASAVAHCALRCSRCRRTNAAAVAELKDHAVPDVRELARRDTDAEACDDAFSRTNAARDRFRLLPLLESVRPGFAAAHRRRAVAPWGRAS